MPVLCPLLPLVLQHIDSRCSVWCLPPGQRRHRAGAEGVVRPPGAAIGGTGLDQVDTGTRLGRTASLFGTVTFRTPFW
jgi:hypothetical protein